MKNRKVVGWIGLTVGIIMLLFGLYSIMNPSIALGSLVLAIAIIAAVWGVAEIIFYVQLEKRTGMGPPIALVSGIFSIVAGVFLMFNTGAGKVAVTVLFPIWFIAKCISGLANLSFTRFIAGTATYWLSLIVNMLGLFFGIVLLFNPFASFVGAGIVVATYIFIWGISNIVTGIQLITG